MQQYFTIISSILLLLTSTSWVQANEYQLMISKQNNELTVEKSGQVIKKYHIASGKGGKGTKRLRGDSKTPLGVYKVTSFKESSRFHYFIQLNYPNLIDAWYGYKK